MRSIASGSPRRYPTTVGKNLSHKPLPGKPMPLTDEVRTSCERIAAEARSVRIDLEAAAEVQPVDPPALDPERHYLEGDPADIADYMLALDAINFGSGWFPTLRKRTLHGAPLS